MVTRSVAALTNATLLPSGVRAGLRSWSASAEWLSRERLPIGLQILGRHFDEETVLKAAYAYERATDWHTKKPPLIS